MSRAFFRLITSLALCLSFALAFAFPASANPAAIVSLDVDAPADTVSARIKKQLKKRGFVVVKDINLLEGLRKNLAKKLGPKFNQQKLNSVHTLVVCQGRYANRLANVDPALLALCPLSIAIVGKDGKTQIHLERPTAVVSDGPAHAILLELENDLLAALKAAQAGPGPKKAGKKTGKTKR